MFGAHKNHKIIANAELQIQNRTMTADVEAKFEKNPLFGEMEDDHSFSKLLQSRVKTSFLNAKSHLLSMYNVG